MTSYVQLLESDDIWRMDRPASFRRNESHETCVEYRLPYPTFVQRCNMFIAVRSDHNLDCFWDFDGQEIYMILSFLCVVTQTMPHSELTSVVASTLRLCRIYKNCGEIWPNSLSVDSFVLEIFHQTVIKPLHILNINLKTLYFSWNPD